MNNPRRTYWTAAIERSICAIMISIGLNSSVQAQIPCRYEVAHIIQAPYCQGPGAHYPPTIGTAISPSSRYVCGYYYSCGFTSYFAFLYDTETEVFTTLPYPAHNLIRANNLNDQFVVGQAAGVGFIYNIATAQTTYLPAAVPPDLGTCSVSAINSGNVVCGTRTFNAQTQQTSAFIWSAQNGFTDLGLINGQSTGASDINDNSIVTGAMVVNNTQHPYLWTANRLIDAGSLAGIGSTISLAITDNLQLVGYGGVPMDGAPPGGASRPFVWSNGTFTQLPILANHIYGFALSVNSAGLIVGLSRPQIGSDLAVLWWNNQIHDLNSLLNSGNYFVSGALNVIEDGRILASGYAGGISSALILAPVPVPIGDVNNDCRVNVPDLLRVINDWGLTKSPADVDHDGVVGLSDLVTVVTHWTNIN